MLDRCGAREAGDPLFTTTRCGITRGVISNATTNAVVLVHDHILFLLKAATAGGAVVAKSATNGRGFMIRTNTTTATHHGPTLLGIGLTVVLAAQLFAGIPIAAAIALIGWGSMLALRERGMHELVLILNFTMYAAVVTLDIAAQFNLRYDVMALADAILALVVLHKAATALS
jgi:hypothetical protein